MIPQALSHACQYYYDNLPPDTFQTVCKSAAYSYTFSLLWRLPSQWAGKLNLALPLSLAGVAALASLIYALTTPIFNAMFGDNEVYIHREWIKEMVNMTIRIGIVAYLTITKVNFVAAFDLGPPSFHLLTSTLKLAPDACDFIGLDFIADNLRSGLRFLHLYPEAGSNSIYLNI